MVCDLGSGCVDACVSFMELVLFICGLCGRDVFWIDLVGSFTCSSISPADRDIGYFVS